MTWPTAPRSAHEIPHEEDPLSFEFVSSTTDATIADFVFTNAGILEMITCGDEKKEQMLGSLLIQLASTAANKESFAVGDRRRIQR